MSALVARPTLIEEPLFPPLPAVEGGWQCVACDAGLHFGTYSAKGQGRAPSRHYGTHAPLDLLQLPLQDVVARDCWLWLWWPDPHLLDTPKGHTRPAIITVTEAWGFEFSAKAFTYVKTLESLARRSRTISTDDIESMFPMGGGLTTRKNSESCWLFRRGNPQRLSRGVREVIVAPRREHSRKPAEFYSRVETYCPGPRLNMFTRETYEGWVSFGNEATKFDQEKAMRAAE
jgi:N6-adenosine-specific RNA methylase IME4